MLKALLKFFIGEGDTGEAKGCSCGCASRQSAPVRPVEGGASGGVGELEKFVRFVVDSLVDSPADVKLETVETANGFTIRVSCKKEDIGKIVGKHGKTIMAIRSLVSGAAGRLRKHVSVEVLD